jgi:hypothetical protein
MTSYAFHLNDDDVMGKIPDMLPQRTHANRCPTILSWIPGVTGSPGGTAAALEHTASRDGP